MPVFDQSVARQVGFDLSKIRTPSSISFIMMDLDSLNRLSSSLFHTNGVPGLRAWRKGCMRLEAAKA